MPATSPIQPAFSSSFFVKFAQCLFTGFALFNVFGTLMEAMPDRLSLRSGNAFLNLLNAGIFISGLLFAILYPVYWHRKERKKQLDSGFRHALFQGILRYWLAFEISRYGFAKLFQTQFPVVYSRNDSVVSHLNGFDLTWTYFGHSYTLAVIIGLLQIIGSILLLFRRSTLMGTIILLPILLNIALIDWFFDIAWGALMNSIAFSLGLLFLLFLRWDELKAILLRTMSHMPGLLPKGFKYAIRVAVITIPLAIILYYTTFNSHKALSGKWQVVQFIRNGDTLQNEAWLTDSTAWKNIYIEVYGKLALCPNPYTYEEKRSQWANYEYDSARHNIQLILPGKNKKDTFNMDVSFLDNRRQMEWKSIHTKNAFIMKLAKVEK